MRLQAIGVVKMFRKASSVRSHHESRFPESPEDEFISAYHSTKPKSQRRLEEGNAGNLATPYKSFNEDYSMERETRGKIIADDGNSVDDEEEHAVYIVKQRHGYAAIFFSVIQTAVLATMIYECGLAPFGLNPMIGPYPDGLSYWGGKNAYLIVTDHEWWRLVSPIILHAGVLHLIGNVAVQIDAGAFFEREWGTLPWLAIFLISAVGSSLLSCVVMPNMVSVGSSGAVCGLFGGKLAEIFCRACESKRSVQGRVGHDVRREQLGAVLCSVFIVGLFSFVPYVDWGAHLGGLLGGLCVGMLIFPFRIKSPYWKVLWFLVGVAMTFSYFSLLFDRVYNDIEVAEELQDVCEYYKKMSEGYECNCQLQNQ